MKGKADHVVQELLETEKVYVRNLEAVVRFYMDPVESSSNLDPGNVFGNTRDLLDLHRVLLEDLTRAGKDLARVATIMTAIAPRLRIYIEYCNGYTEAVSNLAKWQQKNSKAKVWLAEQKSASASFLDSKGGELDLASLLITPVQRIPRYVMLLRELAKATEDRNLSKAAEALEACANDINEAKRAAENLQKIVEMQERFGTWNMELVRPSRRLLSELTDCTVKERSCSLFVFNDLLLAATPLDSADPHCELVHVAHLFVGPATAAVDSDARVAVTGPQDRMDIVCPSADAAQAVCRAVHAQADGGREEHEAAAGDSDALQPCTYEGLLDKKSSSGPRFLERWVQLRGSTLFWFESQKALGNPSGSLCLAGTTVKWESTKGLPNTIQVEGSSSSKTYWFRRAQRSQVAEWVRHFLAHTSATVAPLLRQQLLQESPPALDLAISLRLAPGMQRAGFKLCLVLKRRGQHGKWEVLGEPAVVAGEHGSLWMPMSLAEKDPMCKLSVYALPASALLAARRRDFSSSSLSKCGSVFFSRSALLLPRSSSPSRWSPLASRGIPTGASALLSLGPRFRDHSHLLLSGAAADGLPAARKLKRSSDPFLSFQRLSPSHQFQEVFRSDAQKSTLQPRWPQSFRLSVEGICGGDYDRPLVLQVLHLHRDRPPALLGQAKSRLAELLSMQGKSFSLSHPEHRSSQGRLRFARISLSPRYSLFHFLAGSLRLRIVLGVDLSLRNGPASSLSSLHHPARDQSAASYAAALRTTAAHLLHWCPAATLHAWGLSAAHAPLFELGGTAGHSQVQGVAALLEGYANARSLVRPGPVVTAAPFVERVLADSEWTQQRQCFTVALLLLPSQPSDAPQVRAALQQASSAPAWVAGVAVGSGAAAVLDKEALGLDAVVQLQQCRSDPAGQLLRALLQGLPEKLEECAGEAGLVPEQYFGQEPQTQAQRTEASRLDFHSPETVVTSGGAPPALVKRPSVATVVPNTYAKPNPYAKPSSNPYSKPSSNPYSKPSSNPYSKPSSNPYSKPSSNPYSKPSSNPYSKPSSKPSSAPTRYGAPPQSAHPPSTSSSNYFHGGSSPSSNVKPHLQAAQPGHRYFHSNSDSRKVVSVQTSSGTQYPSTEQYTEKPKPFMQPATPYPMQQQQQHLHQQQQYQQQQYQQPYQQQQQVYQLHEQPVVHDPRLTEGYVQSSQSYSQQSYPQQGYVQDDDWFDPNEGLADAWSGGGGGGFYQYQ